jgi:D-sedoheptulose 7-phosphate isomerase
MTTDASAERAAAVEIFEAAIALHTRMRDGDHTPALEAAAAIRAGHAAGGKVLLFGNGGSAADAQHMAAELVSRFARERRALAALSLAADTSVLTAVGNDFTFDRVFVRQIEALGRRGDVAFAISTSGGSPNVVKALEAARALGLRTVALTGRSGGAAGAAAEIHINVPDESTARVQEVHRTVIHVICELVERSM